jgi:hypothetical protein
VEQRRLRIASEFSASASLRQDASELTLAANGTLLCQTLIVGNIVDDGPVCEALERFEEAPDVFHEWMQMIGIEMRDWPEQPPPGGSQADIFWKTMLNDSVELDTSESPFYRRTNEGDYVQLRNLWLTLLSPLGGFLAKQLSLSLKSHDDLMSQAPSTIYHIFVCLWHRRLFRTEKGWIGLAPENSSPGDEVHVLLGSPAPYILRRVNESFRADGQTEAVPAYTIIGHAYLHEIMFGEAFKNDGGKSIESIALY